MYVDPTNPETNIWYVGGPDGTILYYMNTYWVESGDSGYYAYKTTGQPQTKNQIFNLQGQPNCMELSPDKKTFLMPTMGGGIILFDLATGTQAVHQELGSPVGSYDAATYDSSGNIWFVYRDSLTTERLARWNYDPTAQTYTSTSYDVELYGVKKVNALHLHGDTVWVGTAQSGVFQYAYLAPKPTPPTLTAILPQNHGTEIQVYPNPTTGNIHITLPESGLSSIFWLFNPLGQVISTQALVGSSPTLDLSAFAPGLYTVRITDSQSKILATHKLIVE